MAVNTCCIVDPPGSTSTNQMPQAQAQSLASIRRSRARWLKSVGRSAMVTVATWCFYRSQVFLKTLDFCTKKNSLSRQAVKTKSPAHWSPYGLFVSSLQDHAPIEEL